MNNVCGIPLTIIGLIIAWLYLVLSMAMVIILCILLVHLNDLTEDVVAQVTNPDLTECVRILVPIFAYLSFLLAVAFVFASGLLILGIHTRHHRYMAPWLTVCSLIIFITLFEIFCNVITIRKSNVPAIVFTLFQCPMFCIIYSLYTKVHDENLTYA